MSEEKSKSSVGHGLPSDLQTLREDKKPVDSAMKTKGKFTYVPALSADYVRPKPQPTDKRVVMGGSLGESRAVSGPAKLPNYQVDVSTIKKDRTTSDRISTIRTVNGNDGIALNIFQKGSDGTHRLVLVVTGLPDDEGNLVLEVRTKNNAENLPLYQVKTTPPQMERREKEGNG